MRKPTKPREAHEGSKAREDDSLPRRKPYRAPQLKILGDFRKLTADKGGTMGDSTGKPNTRITGTPG